MFHYTKTYINNLFHFLQVHALTHQTIASLALNQLVASLGYVTSCAYFQLKSAACVSPLRHVISTHCSHHLHLHVKHLHISVVSLHRDLRLKVQHLQRDLFLELQHVMML